MTRALVFILSLVAAAGMVCRGMAWMDYEKGEDREELSLVRQAARLDPLVSEYAYEEYVQSGDLAALERAIRLEPTKPSYHMFYGLKLIEREPRTAENDQAAVREICLGAELKPYSKEYRTACEDFRAAVT